MERTLCIKQMSKLKSPLGEVNNSKKAFVDRDMAVIERAETYGLGIQAK